MASPVAAEPPLGSTNPDSWHAAKADVTLDATDALDDAEAAEVVLFLLKECYVYTIPPRKSAASYRADEWNINKWAWEGAMRIVAKGDHCTIRLEDLSTGELFAQAPIWPGQPVPVEPVIDSSRFFVLRIEDTSEGPTPPSSSSSSSASASARPGSRVASAQQQQQQQQEQGQRTGRHAFIGIGFRERPQAYDFQAAVYDHVKYLNKKKEAQDMEQEFHSRPAVDYSLKEGQTIHLDIKKPLKSSAGAFTKMKLTNKFPSPATPGAAPVPGLLMPPPAPAGTVTMSTLAAPTATGAAPAAAGAGAGAAEADGTLPDAALSTGEPTGAPIRHTSGEHDIVHTEFRAFASIPSPPTPALSTAVDSSSIPAASTMSGANGEKYASASSADGVEDDFGDFQAA